MTDKTKKTLWNLYISTVVLSLSVAIVTTAVALIWATHQYRARSEAFNCAVNYDQEYIKNNGHLWDVSQDEIAFHKAVLKHTCNVELLGEERTVKTWGETLFIDPDISFNWQSDFKWCLLFWSVPILLFFGKKWLFWLLQN